MLFQISSGSGHLLNSLGCQMMTDGCFDLPSLTSFISQVLVMALSLADHGNDISELLRTVQELVTHKKRVRIEEPHLRTEEVHLETVIQNCNSKLLFRTAILNCNSELLFITAIQNCM